MNPEPQIPTNEQVARGKTLSAQERGRAIAMYKIVRDNEEASIRKPDLAAECCYLLPRYEATVQQLEQQLRAPAGLDEVAPRCDHSKLEAEIALLRAKLAEREAEAEIEKRKAAAFDEFLAFLRQIHARPAKRETERWHGYHEATGNFIADMEILARGEKLT